MLGAAIRGRKEDSSKSLALAIGDVEVKRLLAYLENVLKNNPDPESRRIAVGALTHLRGPDVISLLRKALDDPDPKVRLAVVDVLRYQGKFGGDKVVEILGDTFDDLDRDVRKAAVLAAGSLDTEGGWRLVKENLTAGNRELRLLAAKAFSQRPNLANRDILISRFDMETDPEVHQEILFSLQYLGAHFPKDVAIQKVFQKDQGGKK